MSDGFITSASDYTGGGADFGATSAEPASDVVIAQTDHQADQPSGAPVGGGAEQGNEGDTSGEKQTVPADSVGTGGGFITNDPYGAHSYDASGGYSHEAAQGGYGGLTVTSDAMAAYQQADAYAIKSDPEHGKLLKKVMGPSDVKMFIGGLSHETTTAKLWEYFAQYGEVEDVDIKTDPHTGESRGFGFLLYKEETAIEEVVNNGPHNLDGKRIDPKKATKNSKIFVGGLKPETSDEDVRKYFETEFGEIDTLDRGRDKETPELGKPFAFMVMKKESIAGAICDQKWHQIDDKRVECKLAVDRQKRGGWGGGGGGGYGGGGGGYGGYGGYGGGGYGGGGGGDYNYGPSFNQGYGSFQQKGQNRYQPY